ncbi:MAG: hypothetical protein ACMXYD_01425 [Candidatus Woesearchaeota archaeon]
MTTFIDLIYNLEYLGVSDVILPFFLVFTIVFAVMQKSKILGTNEDVKRYNVILSLAMAFAVVIPHILGTYPPGMNAVIIINSALPQVSVFLIAIVMLLLMLGAFGLRWPGSDVEKNGGGIIVIASLLIVIYIFATSAGLIGGGQFPWWLWFLTDPQTQTMLITILVFGVVVWLITRDENKNKDPVTAFIPKDIRDNDK